MILAACALLPRNASDEEWLGLLGQRLTRAANIKWLVENGDRGAEEQEREVEGSAGGEVRLWACLECGASQALEAPAEQGPCPCGSTARCKVQQACKRPDAERLKEVVLRLHAELRPLWRPVPAAVCAPLWGALITWLTLLQRSSGRIARGVVHRCPCF